MQKRRDSLGRTVNAIRLAGQENERNLHQRIERIKEQQLRNADETALLAERAVSAQAVADRFLRLVEAKAASSVELHEREEQANLIKAQLITSRRQKADLAIALVAARGELDQNRARVETQLSDFERELATLDQQMAEVHSREALAITAPMAGTVAALNIQSGQPTGAAPLLVLLPEGASLIAQLYAPSRAIGFIEPGQQVRMRFHAFPYQKFGQHEGVVTEVTRSPLSPSEIFEKLRAVSANGSVAAVEPEGLYRVSVRLHAQDFTADGRQIQLLPGMTFDADVLQERRKIIDWLLDPLRGLAKRID